MEERQPTECTKRAFAAGCENGQIFKPLAVERAGLGGPVRAKQKGRVLIIDEDSESCEVAAKSLQAELFETTCIMEAAPLLKTTLFEEGHYDLIVLSLMLSAISGFELLKAIRSRLPTPIVVFADRYKKMDGIRALEMGADAFMLKPFNPRVLVAHARAILRRTQGTLWERQSLKPGTILVGDVELDTKSRVANRCGVRLNLTSVEFGFLEMLLGSAGQVITSEQLAAGVLGRELLAFDRSVSVHVSNLRKKLGHRLGEIERIKTMRGRGYIYMNPQGRSFHVEAGSR
ncbi:MAG: response regulator transcription factor [Syntrophobacteraceae bacterium]